jgi:hypothetical protein
MKAVLTNKLYVLGFTLVYTVGYFFLAILSTGAGHGTTVFLAPLFTWILLLVAIFLSSRADTLLKKILFFTCLALHYLHILVFLRPLLLGDIDPGTAGMWRLGNGPAMFLFISAWYAAGQVVIWLRFIRSLRTSRAALT